MIDADEQTEPAKPHAAAEPDEALADLPARTARIETLPLADRAPAFLGLHDELLAELEGGDGER
ncbi:hypothetical protein [Leucobacter sp. M11]|uniref:hypothetical protein n=1 Tax=Leucobacter sp. M11 TaxID=2993565 RepID=UPI002D809029|nr:hypothetical protein [Leucobacter sp. M11]MEB4613816.1 hypothetical protein [Leucobacter sp. M11]